MRVCAAVVAIITTAATAVNVQALCSPAFTHAVLCVPSQIAKLPYKVLDAPALLDDYYLNLVEWSAQNVIAVGLGRCVYLWSAHTSKVTRLAELGEDNGVASVSWTQRVQGVSRVVDSMHCSLLMSLHSTTSSSHRERTAGHTRCCRGR